jgi:hypothetical protein
MDKQLAFILIGFFVICACFITYAALGGSKKSLTCKWIAIGYAALVWVCIIALTAVTILYE